MSVIILEIQDINDDVLSIAKNNASVGTIEGILAESRSYAVKDDDGEINFIGNGLLALNNWRDQVIEETNTDGATLFKGLIHNVGLAKTDLNGFVTNITGKSPVATVLDWAVDSNDSSTHAGFEIVGAHAIGETVLTVDTGASTITLPAQISFTDSLVPRYGIVAVSGTPTTSITIARGLDIALADNDPIRITIGQEKTGPQEIFDSLIAIDAAADVDITGRIGSSFATLNTIDTAAGHKIFVHRLVEDKVKFRDHLATVLEMTDLLITIDEEGTIDLVRSPDYQGNTILETLGTDELMVPYTFKEDSAKLVIGYDCLFKTSDTTISVASGDVDQTLIDAYKGRDRWQPVALQGQSADIFDYGLVYANASTADFFGESRLGYYGRPRNIFTGSMRQSFFGDPLNRIIPQLGKEFNLSVPVAVNQFIVNAPVKVIGFQYNDPRLFYNQIVLEMSNNPSPALSVDRTFPSLPVVTSLVASALGFTAVLESFTGTLFFQVFYEDQTFLILEVESGTSTCVTLASTRLNAGQTYFVRFFTQANGYTSAKTDFFEFIPLAQGDGVELEDGSGSLLLEPGDKLLLE